MSKKNRDKVITVWGLARSAYTWWRHKLIKEMTIERSKKDPLGFVATEEQRLLIEEEMLRLRVTDQLEEAINASGQTLTQVANALNTTKENISQILSGERNLTLRTMVRMAFAAGCRWMPYLENVATEGRCFTLTESHQQEEQ